MEVRATNEQLECQVVPRGWRVEKIGNIATVHRGASPRPISAPRWFSEDSEVGWVRITDITKAHKYLLETEQRVSDDGMKNSRFVKENSLIMSICATVGKPIITRMKACIHDGFVVFEGLRETLEYVYYYLSFIENEWAKHGQTGSQMNLNTGIINNEIILIPDDPKEQTAIATALSDADAFINSLEKLIDKKQNIKQGAMQQLLTGKKRLPGFSGEWDTKKLGEFIKFQVGYPFKSEYFNGKDQGLRLAKNRDLKSDDQVFFYDDNFLTEYLVDNDDILVGMDGEFLTCRWNKGIALLNQRVGRLVAKKEVNLIFLYYYLKEPLRDIEKRTSSTTVKHLSHSDLERIEIPMPEQNEQSAIAQVLSDMDAEIEELEDKLAKYKMIKQGMMQELLTGRRRLI